MESDKSPVKVAEKFWRMQFFFLEIKRTLFLISLVTFSFLWDKHGENEFHSIALVEELPVLLIGCDCWNEPLVTLSAEVGGFFSPKGPHCVIQVGLEFDSPASPSPGLSYHAWPLVCWFLNLSVFGFKQFLCQALASYQCLGPSSTLPASSLYTVCCSTLGI